MTRIAVIADSHFDEHSRFEECVRIHHWIAENAASRGCTLWLHAGDLYERKSTPRERQAVAAWVQHMADVVGPGIIVRGNHDAMGDLPLLSRLDTNGRSVHVVEDARVLHVGGVAIACLAWPQRANIHAMLDSSASRDLAEGAAGDALRGVLRGLGAQLNEDEPRILLAHAMVRGSRVSTGQPLVGCDFELGLEDLALANADFYALGHVHMGNAWDVAGASAVYPGSPRRTAFGELECKGYLVLDAREPGRVDWERIETPATPMIHLEGKWRDGQLLGLEHPPLRGAEVRLRYTTPADQREAARAQALEWRDRIVAAGAVHVKVEEELIVEQRARAPEVARALTVEEKLQSLWRVKGWEPGERAETLLRKARQIEEESHAA
jgi:DNA repair exonuclease SbcCD nuclease subunit